MRQLLPGDFVLAISDSGTGRMKQGVVIAVTHPRDDHVGCDEDRLLVLWFDSTERLTRECDCGVILPLVLGI